MSYFKLFLTSLAVASWLAVGDPGTDPANGAAPVVVEARQPGSSALDVVQTVTAPLEKALRGMEDVRRISSLSLEGRCFVRLELETSANSKKVREAVARRLTDAAPTLPEACVRLGVQLLPEASPSFFVVALRASSQREPTELSRLARDSIRPRLQRVPSVSQVHILGQANEQVRIVCDPNRLIAYDLPAADVLSALRKLSKRPPENVGELGDAVVATRNSVPILVRDLAVVEIGVQQSGVAGLALRKDKRGLEIAEPLVLLVVQPLPGNIEDFGKSLDMALKDIEHLLPGVRLDQRLFRPSAMTAALRLPPGTKLEERARIARTVAETSLRVPQLQAVYWMAPAASDEVLLLPWPTAAKGADLRTDLRSVLSELGELKGVGIRVGGLRSPLLSWPGESSQLVTRVSGDDIDELRKTADQVHARMSKIEGIVDLDRAWETVPQLTVDLDLEKCARMGLNMTDVMQILRMYQGGLEVEGLKIAGRPAVLMLPGPLTKTPFDLRELRVRNIKSQWVTLDTVAEARVLVVPQSLYRDAGKLCIVVSCNIHGRNVANVRDDIRKAVQELSRREARIELE